MDNSTEGVTLLAGFIFDVLKEYESMQRACAPIFELASDLDRDHPEAMVPFETYNLICDWIEANVGKTSIRAAGRAIGRRAFDAIVESNALTDPTPSAMMSSLKWAASTLIQDPKGRGWEIDRDTHRKIIMRRTQTFHCLLQEGVLLSLLERTGVLMPTVRHINCTRSGDEYCRYELSWLTRAN